MPNPNPQPLIEFFDQMGFKTLKAKWATKEIESGKLGNGSSEKLEIGSGKLGIANDSNSIKSASSGSDEPQLQTPNSELLTLRDIPHNYILVSDDAGLKAMIDELKNVSRLAVDLETTSLNAMQCEIVGLSFCAEEGKAFYVAVDKIKSANELRILAAEGSSQTLSAESGQFDFGDNAEIQSELLLIAPVGDNAEIHSKILFNAPDGAISPSVLDTDFALEKLREILEHDAIEKVGQNIKFDSLILKNHGVNVSPISFDSMLASYVLNPDHKHGMDDLARKWLQYSPVSITALIGAKKATQISMRDVPVETVAEYAAEDADVTFKLCNLLQQQLTDDATLNKLAREIEFPLITVLRDMEFNGIAIDVAKLKEIGIQVRSATVILREKIMAEAGMPFNPDSPKQLAEEFCCGGCVNIQTILECACQRFIAADVRHDAQLNLRIISGEYYSIFRLRYKAGANRTTKLCLYRNVLQVRIGGCKAPGGGYVLRIRGVHSTCARIHHAWQRLDVR